MKNRKREICTSGSVRDEAGQPPTRRLGGAAAVWPVVVRAQQGDYVRCIALMSNTDESDRNRVSQTVKIVEDELKKLGWVGRRKVEVDYYWHVNTVARGDEAVAEALKRSPDVIFVTNGQPLIAAKAATSTIPIVFTGISEPVGRGFVQSLAHPGGNITGFTNMEPTVGPKWLELLKEMAPAITRVAVVCNMETGAGALFARSIAAVGQKFAVEVIVSPVRDPADISSAIEVFSQQPNGGLINPPDGFSATHYKLFAELTTRYRLPSIYQDRTYVDAGGLASYAVNFFEQSRQAVGYIDRILRGEKPADLPVQQTNNFVLTINLKTAKSLGLTIPETLLATADEVIQ
jgi:putative tryptophan/tyrosine transport system substrate-binding protein